MKTSICFICLFLSLSGFCREKQQRKESVPSVRFSLGVNDFHFRDDYLSPHTFSKAMFISGLSYQLRTQHYLHSVDLTYSYGHPNSKIQPRDVTANMGSLAYSVLREIASKQIAGNPLDLMVGAGVSAFISNTTFIAADKHYSYEFFDQSWYCSKSFNLLFRSEYQLSKQNGVSLQFTLPVFSFVSRPENGHSFNPDNAKVISNFLNSEDQGKPEFLWDNVALVVDLGFKQQLGNRCNLTIDYVFNYATSDRPLPLQMYMNRFLVGFEFLF